MGQGRTVRQNISSNEFQERNSADKPAEQRSEALVDALIRFSLIGWRTEIDSHPPRWSIIQGWIFSTLNEERNWRETP